MTTPSRRLSSVSSAISKLDSVHLLTGKIFASRWPEFVQPAKTGQCGKLAGDVAPASGPTSGMSLGGFDIRSDLL